MPRNKPFRVGRNPACTHTSGDDGVKVPEVPMAKGHEVCVERSDALQAKPYVPCWGEFQQLGRRVIGARSAVDERRVNLDTAKHACQFWACVTCTHTEYSTRWLTVSGSSQRFKTWALYESKQISPSDTRWVLMDSDPHFVSACGLTTPPRPQRPSLALSAACFYPHCDGLWTPTTKLQLLRSKCLMPQPGYRG